MIRFLSFDQLSLDLADSMFRHRTEQFKDRLGWDVKVNDCGWEYDEYDDLDPTYIIWEEGGVHRASIRALPTTGRTMTNEHFLHIIKKPISHPLIWECTRFCIAPDGSSREAAGVLYGGLEWGLRQGLKQALGVFDSRMPRIYARLGHAPTIIGEADGISVGLWDVTKEAQERIAERSKLNRDLFEEI